ncbi:uncharacterized protein LOC110459960 [Mizuhopecten yessoensis]|uniref:Uncharacterized protein n=1 Tax=Mizuhopecten yessoensis TaxID=6573 RepID=A0A210Q3B5_MIZYE|nr:uncharacterized protein LOC110459960 [Mizuhopecten yessoensis]OWF43220.1 hypothetical protein KP79_PYT18828 [Mizuhopecten yessoensis]
MAFILNALRSKWYHRYSVEDLSPPEPVQIVSCISLTDLSDKKIRPLSVLSEPGSSVFTQKKRGSKRPLSSASQLSWNFESELKAGNSSLSFSDGGYSSLNESLESLSRTDSIQNRSLRIWRKRRPWLAKKHRLSGLDGDNSIGSSESILERVEEKCNENVNEESCSPKIRPRSVHFDESLSDSSDDDDKENTNSDELRGSTISLARQSSIHLKSWQLRRQRRALKNMSKRTNRRSCPELRVHTQERQP